MATEPEPIRMSSYPSSQPGQDPYPSSDPPAYKPSRNGEDTPSYKPSKTSEDPSYKPLQSDRDKTKDSTYKPSRTTEERTSSYKPSRGDEDRSYGYPPNATDTYKTSANGPDQPYRTSKTGADPSYGPPPSTTDAAYKKPSANGPGITSTKYPPVADQSYYSGPPPNGADLSYMPPPMATDPLYPGPLNGNGPSYNPPIVATGPAGYYPGPGAPLPGSMSYPPPPMAAVPSYPPPPMNGTSYNSAPPPPLNGQVTEQMAGPAATTTAHATPGKASGSGSTSALPLSTTSDGSSLRDTKARTAFALREYMHLQRRRHQKDEVGIEERLRIQASTVLGDLKRLSQEVAHVAKEAEGHRWRKFLVGGAIASFIPIVRALFRRPSNDSNESSSNDTEYAFKKSKSLIRRILDNATERPGIATVAFFVFAILYVFQNEVTLRVARTVSKRIKDLSDKVERCGSHNNQQQIEEEDLKMLEGWRWRVLMWST